MNMRMTYDEVCKRLDGVYHTREVERIYSLKIPSDATRDEFFRRISSAQESSAPPEIKTEFNNPLYLSDEVGRPCLRDASTKKKVALSDVARKFNDLLGRSIADDQFLSPVLESTQEKTREDRVFDAINATLANGDNNSIDIQFMINRVDHVIGMVNKK